MKVRVIAELEVEDDEADESDPTGLTEEAFEKYHEAFIDVGCSEVTFKGVTS